MAGVLLFICVSEWAFVFWGISKTEGGSVRGTYCGMTPGLEGSLLNVGGVGGKSMGPVEFEVPAGHSRRAPVHLKSQRERSGLETGKGDAQAVVGVRRVGPEAEREGENRQILRVWGR